MSGNENPRIQKTENARDLDHHAIRSLFTPINTTPANNTAAEYNALAHMWEVGVEVFAYRIKASIDAAWSGGSAAPKAQEAIKRYTDKAHELTPVMQALAGRVGDAASAIVSTQSALPGEVNEKPWWHKDSWPWVGIANDSVVKDRDEDAQTAMETYYVNRFVSLDGQIPVLPTPVDPTSPLDISAPTKSTGTGDGPYTPGTSGTTDPGTPGSTSDEPKQPGSEDDKSGEDPTVSQTTITPDTATTPTNSNNATSTVPQTTKPSLDTSTVPTTTTSGTPSTSGLPSSPGISSAPGTSSTPSPGRSVSGAPSTPNVTGSPTAAAASAGRAGMSGMGMGGAGAGRGKSDEESTHETPDYLVNEQNTEELIGEAPKTVPGGVIGGDHDDR
ncbi:hypothetical protein OG874_02560 [Nocardia sp. NBC_00565]|uniref:hypothetical protein n=1 Tax=Nocardia sp. NBC_00565 TaxID=2975993 RepID=UPI002E814697|nr:hypothetical protein [Nocardia sp. NBC_00565]WUC04120.1 hypothetical protein OG874_02560 [Nocardia sp. NBC_00565]